MSADKVKIVLKKIKDSTHILHPDSNLVLKSAKDKTVIGRYEENKIVPLIEEDLELCTKWNFKHDPGFLQPEEEGDEEEEEGGEEEGGDEGQEEGDRDEGEKDSPNDNTHEEEHQASKKEFVSVDTEQLKSQIHFNYYVSELNKLQVSLSGQLNKVETDNLSTIKELQTNLENKTNELATLQVEFNKLKTKFDNIKSLFS